MAKLTVKEYMAKRAEFAECVLDALSGKKDWDADMLDYIGETALRLELGKVGRNGYFKRIPEAK